MGADLEEIRRVYAHADCIATADQVGAAFDSLARGIAEQLEDTCPLVLCVLTGGVVTAGQLLPRLVFPLELDYIHASRYENRLTGGEIHWRALPRTELAGRTVLVVDDILDKGDTLAAIIDYCREQGAERVASAVLVRKRVERPPATAADFVGLEIPDRYVFGVGMDYRGFWRNLPGLYAVAE